MLVGISPSILLLIVALCAKSLQAEKQTDHVIYVDANHGVQNSTCWTGGSALPCQTINLALEGMQQWNSTTVFIEKGSYTLDFDPNVTTFQWMHNIAIIGNDTLKTDFHPHITVKCNQGSGLSFLYSSNITIKNIVFSGCGALHTSTSRNFASEVFSFLEFYSGMYFLFCRDVSLFQVVVTEGNGIGAVFYSTVGTNSILYSTFSFNQVNSTAFPGGGGLYIEFAYCTPGDVNCSNEATVIPPIYYSNASYLIYSTFFRENAAKIIDPVNYTFILPQNRNHLAFGRGGGLSVFFKGNAVNNTVVVSESQFINNKALWGAGVFVEYQDMSSNNNFEIYSSFLVENECYNKESTKQGTGGGGSRIGFIFFNKTHARDNHILFDTCSFIENQAYFGGGLSFYAAREPTESSPTNTLEFRNCVWILNIARLGSAVDLSVWHVVPKGAIVEPVLWNCSFYNNTASYTSTLGSLVGVGAVYLDSIPVQFVESVVFEKNTHSALAGVNTGIYFQADCIANFTKNTGRNGGAIALLGYAFIETSSQTQLNFTDNSAEIRGGAIYGQSVGEHDLISSRNCFIRFSNISATPQNWTSKFFFERNSANGKNNSIYATSLLTCIWGGAFGSTEQSAKDVFCWNRWYYASGNCTNEISTSPATFSQNNSAYHMQAIPGRRSPLPVVVYDDRGTDVTRDMVLLAHANSSNFEIDSSSRYISDDTIELHGKPNSRGILSLETIDPRVLSTKVYVDILPCPPGMVPKGTGKNIHCECHGDYGGLIQCYGTEFQGKLQRGGWMGYRHNESSAKPPNLLAGQCPYCSLLTEDQYFYLPRNITQLNEVLCKKINRTGVLCGQCVDGYGPAVNSESYVCKDCSADDAKYYWTFYLLTEFLPITVFFFFVLLFNISATSAPANAFVFFAQVLTTSFKIDGDGAILLSNVTSAASTLKTLYTIPYDVWNLNFFRPILPEYCLSPYISTFQLLSTGYVTAIYPLILIVISYAFVWLYEHGVMPVVCICRPIHTCFAKFQRIWNLRRSIIHAFATFLLLSYTKFTLVSLILLTATPLVDDGGNPAVTVVYYDGTIDYLSPQHIPYVIAAVVVLATFVAIPPIILTVPSVIRCLQKFFGFRLCIRLQPHGKFQQFLSAFQGCYKDGTEVNEGEDRRNNFDLRWFAGLYFIFRIILFVVYASTPDWFLQYVLQQLVCIIAFFLFAALRPYKQDFYNTLDAAVFAILAAISSLTMYNYYLTILGTQLSVWAFVTQYILIFVPLLYISVFLVWHFWNTYGARIMACARKLTNGQEAVSQEQPDENNGDFLTFTQESGRLHGVNRYQASVASSNSPEAAPLIGPASSSVQSQSRVQYGATQSTVGLSSSTTWQSAAAAGKGDSEDN